MTTNELNELAITLATQILEIDEGHQSTPYYDIYGYPTIGIGFRILDTSGAQLPAGSPLPDTVMTKFQAEAKLAALLQSYIAYITADTRMAPAYNSLSPLRRAVILSMTHQCGIQGIRGFLRMWTWLLVGNYRNAAHEIVDSKSGREPKLAERFSRNAQMILSGKMLSYYNRNSG